MAPAIPPPIKPAMRTAGTRRMAGKSGRFSATTVERSAPAMIWLSPPMLITFVRKAIVMPAPTRISGVALTAVAAIREPLPNAPSNIALKPSTGLAPSARSMVAPNAKATTAAMSGTSVPTRLFSTLAYSPLATVRLGGQCLQHFTEAHPNRVSRPRTSDLDALGTLQESPDGASRCRGGRGRPRRETAVGVAAAKVASGDQRIG